MESVYFISFEETMEGTAHIMMLMTSLVAWSTFYFNKNKSTSGQVKHETEQSDHASINAGVEKCTNGHA